MYRDRSVCYKEIKFEHVPVFLGEGSEFERSLKNPILLAIARDFCLSILAITKSFDVKKRCYNLFFRSMLLRSGQ